MIINSCSVSRGPPLEEIRLTSRDQDVFHFAAKIAVEGNCGLRAEKKKMRCGEKKVEVHANPN